MSELVYVSIISGVFGLCAIILLHLSWRHKLQMTIQAEEISKQRDIKIAKIKNPVKTRRLPRGTRNQLLELLDLLGNEQVQELVQTLAGRPEETEGNSLIKMLMPLAEGFLNARQEQQQTPQIAAQV
jgi:hypothetical protein